MALDVPMANEIHALWKDPAIQKAFENRSKFQLPDSAQHVLDNAARIASPNYVPNTEVSSARSELHLLRIFTGHFAMPRAHDGHS